ncbi:MAG: pyruvate kinase [Candidatus Altimarinota bacterium]
MFQKKTKIVCTIGPASAKTSTLEKMIKAGMNLARLNFSHGTVEDQLQLLKNIRQAAVKLKTNIGIIQDLQGPKIRLGVLPNTGIPFQQNQTIIFSTAIKIFSTATAELIPVKYTNLHQDLKKNDLILIEDGMNRFQVTKIQGQQIYAKALNNGILKTHKGINIPTASISANPLTAKDLSDLEFGIKQKVNYIALSFVRRASDIETLRKILRKNKSSAEIIAKIERHEAVQNIEEIIQATDAVMVARGDLGVEVPAEQVPVIQKMIIKLANKYGKPVIIATEMLQSMIESPRATRAEVSDAANGVYDHADALMLSNETAVGKYVVEAVETLSKVAKTVEENQKTRQLNNLELSRDQFTTNELCHAAAEIAHQIQANVLVAVTHSGYTARQISKQRVFQKIITITDSPETLNKLTLVWGINEIIIKKFPLTPSEIKTFLLQKKLIKKGNKIVIALNTSETQKQISVIEV